MQLDDILNATKAAQVLVERAHKEIEQSNIQPVLSLAALDAEIPLSMLRLPSDPASVSPELSPQRQGSPADGSSSPASQALPGCLRSANTAARKGLRTVSWKSQQLEQVMQEVCAEEERKEQMPAPPDQAASGSLNAMPAASLQRDASSRTISPFATAPVSRVPS